MTPPRRADPDPGLFGPESVTWQVHGDPAMWIAGISSLFLQALHPRAAAGIVQNSRFRTDPFGRLMRTAEYVARTTYGTAAEAEDIGQRVRRLHHKLTATDPRTGKLIRLDEPELLRWVHCAEVASFAYVVRRAGFPLTDALVDRYFDEQRRAAGLVGLDPAKVPGSRREMAAYFGDMRPKLHRSKESETLFRFLRRPLSSWWTLPAQVGYLPVGQLAYSLQPVWAVRRHGHPALPGPLATAELRGFRSAGLVIPGSVRWRYPADHVLRAVERLGAPVYPSVEALPRSA